MNGLIEDDLIQYLRDSRKAKGLDGVGCKAIYGNDFTAVLYVNPWLLGSYCSFYAVSNQQEAWH